MIKIEDIFEAEEGGEESAKAESDDRDSQTEDTFGDTFTGSSNFSLITFGGDILVGGDDNLEDKINESDGSEDADNVTDNFFSDSSAVSTGVNEGTGIDLVSERRIS